ncbi:histidine kinase [Aquimarina algicola]|uniref:Regulator n=1 Tax=Aquimarina algicola TaxID=2589995 RepID=A0A504JJW8_9FLAO|nr:histidine kinase [Aquimarina algicola]TPN87913.1 regulator [Aquimarina algicola]
MLYQLFKKAGLILVIITMISCQDDLPFQVPEVKFKIGDDVTWSKKDIDDSKWATEKGNPGDRIFWIRTQVVQPQKPEPFTPQGVLIYAFGAYEVYWDGVLIGTNGSPGNELPHKKGEMDKSFIIPDSLAQKGNHLLALRMSQQYHKNDDRPLGVVITDYKTLIQEPLVLTSLIYVLAGAFFLTAIYFFILYINNRKFFPGLLFSVCSFLFFLLLIIEYIKFYIPIHYSDFYIRLEIIGVLTFLISFLIPVYFSIQFSFPKRKFLIPFYFLLLVLIYILYHGRYDYTTQLLIISMWIASAIFVSNAVYRKEIKSIIVLCTLLFNILLFNFIVYDIALICSFTILLLCMFYILAIQIKQQRKAYEYSLVETTRLKHELLKKKIQPHFLMNTLTSLIDWVEESPTKGVYFIEALAEEFDLLNQVEDKKLIPISQEIQLCKSFLNIMRYRKEITYLWNDLDIDTTKKIPPAVIHTLVENGITHCSPNTDNQIAFRLTEEPNSNYTKYILVTLATIRNKNKAIQDGTGNKYVKARLTESYGDQWNFDSHSTANGWKNIITIYH